MIWCSSIPAIVASALAKLLKTSIGLVIFLMNLNSAVESNSSGAMELESRQYCG